MTNNEQDNLRQSIEALQDFWSNHEDYDIREKAREYIELYQSNGNSNHFSWVHPEDALYINTNNCKALRWGIPNQIIGDIEKAKFVFGLLNPGTQISTKAGNQCDNITEYVTAEQAEENNTGVNNVHFESKEYSENPNFYLEHVISDENVMAQELKKLYKVFKENRELFINRDEDGNIKSTPYNTGIIKKVAYYFYEYYSAAFPKGNYESAIQNAIDYYYNLFDTMERAKAIFKEKGLNYNVERLFNQAAENIAICNVELFSYRSNGRTDISITKEKELINLPSSCFIADLVLEKLIKDDDSVVVFRNFFNVKTAKKHERSRWLEFIEKSAQKRNMELDDYIGKSIFYLSSKTKGALSKNNIKPYDNSVEEYQKEESQEKVGSVVDSETLVNRLLKELKMQPFVDELNEIIEENS